MVEGHDVSWGAGAAKCGADWGCKEVCVGLEFVDLECPQALWGGVALDGLAAGAFDGACGAFEVDAASGLCEGGDPDEVGSKGREDMDLACFLGDAGEGEVCSVGGLHGLLVGHGYRDGCGGGLEVGEVGVGGKVVAGASGVHYGHGRGGA